MTTRYALPTLDFLGNLFDHRHKRSNRHHVGRLGDTREMASEYVVEEPALMRAFADVGRLMVPPTPVAAIDFFLWRRRAVEQA